jgi:hypothetical protein
VQTQRRSYTRAVFLHYLEGLRLTVIVTYVQIINCVNADSSPFCQHDALDIIPSVVLAWCKFLPDCIRSMRPMRASLPGRNLSAMPEFHSLGELFDDSRLWFSLERLEPSHRYCEANRSGNRLAALAMLRNPNATTNKQSSGPRRRTRRDTSRTRAKKNTTFRAVRRCAIQILDDTSDRRVREAGKQKTITRNYQNESAATVPGKPTVS